MKTQKNDICEILEWDTNFFGFRIGHVLSHNLTEDLIPEINSWSLQNDVNCLYFLSSSKDAKTTRIAEDGGFRMVDIRMTLKARISGKDSSKNNNSREVHVRNVFPEDVDALQAIAREIHHDSRFYCDENFPLNLSDKLFETWIRKSCEGYADAVLVADSGHSPVGYITCHIDKNEGREDLGRIGIIGVINTIRGVGVGRLLLASALDWYAAKGVQEIKVVTQGRNIVAQRLYQRHGFLTEAVEIWYHKWYKTLGATNE
jgi:dTDP-4-amino-4,6-dideoxy-D-galactose acyltransferase